MDFSFCTRLQKIKDHILDIIKIGNDPVRNGKRHVNCFRRLLIHCVCSVSIRVHLVLIYNSNCIFLI